MSGNQKQLLLGLIQLSFLLGWQEVLPCVSHHLGGRTTDNSWLYNLFSVSRHLTRKDLSETTGDRTTVPIRVRCYWNEVGLLVDKVLGPCTGAVMREAPVVLGLLRSQVALPLGLGAEGAGWPGSSPPGDELALLFVSDHLPTLTCRQDPYR